MADLTITPANVGLAETGVYVQVVQVGEGVTQGQTGYKNNEDKYLLADADDTESTAAAKCIFLTAASTDGYAVAAFSGPVDVGATLTVGEQYYVSDTAGGIKPAADLATGDYVTLLGIAIATDTLQLDISASGVQVPA
jgi:hypothetical protein